MTGWIGYLGLPPDAVAWTAFALALLCLVVAWREPAWVQRALAPARRFQVVSGLAMLAALLSLGYVSFYLRGGPRIVDATSYYLQARALAHGWLAFPVLEPVASFQGRFLVSPGGSPALGVIFPPGYSAVLALGFLVGVPLLVGPLIAAGLVVVTHALARELTERDDVALLAAALSALSAVLRYHTADTMSHGWCALLLSVSVLAALRSTRRWWILGGIALGWLVATRPVSGMALLPVLAFLLYRKREAWLAFGLAALPGCLLLLFHQRIVTGQWLISSQQFYYQLADGPPGCFAYGLGVNVGCRFEHGEYVQAVMPGGFGLAEVLRTTWARVHTHLRDPANLHVLVVFLLAGVVGARHNRRLLVPAAGVLAVVLAYAPFYYDASYPGGGARLYVDAIPLEHVLIAQGFFLLRAWKAALPLVLLGFATQTSFDHRALATREGGRPMFEPAVLRRAGVAEGLVFLTTDHGFNLAFDPSQRVATDGMVFARLRGDANDHLLWERLGRPPVFRYVYDPSAPVAHPHVEPYQLEPLVAHRYEGEDFWPALRVDGGWVHPGFPPCASGHRGLTLHATDPGGVRITSEILVPAGGSYSVRVGWAAATSGAIRLELALGGVNVTAASVQRERSCWVQSFRVSDLPAGSQPLFLHLVGEPATLDFVELAPARD